MIIIVTVLVGLATVAAILRLYARFKLRVRIEIDDYLCFTALFFLYGLLIQLILCGCALHFVQILQADVIKRVCYWRQRHSHLRSLSRNCPDLWQGAPFTKAPRRALIFADLHRQPIHLLRTGPRPQDLLHLLLPPYLLYFPSLQHHLLCRHLAHWHLGRRHLPDLCTAMPAATGVLG